MLDKRDLNFIECVANGMTRTDAYIECYETKSKNRKSLVVLACRTWNKPEIQEEYMRLLKEQSKNIDIPVQVIVKKLLDQALWLEENRTHNSCVEYRRTLESLNAIVNPTTEDGTEDKLRELICKIDMNVTNK